MLFASDMRGPAPRANARNRAEGTRNNSPSTIAPAEQEADFATLHLARPFGLELLLAQVVAALARISHAAEALQ